jgi:hypothetical protein
MYCLLRRQRSFLGYARTCKGMQEGCGSARLSRRSSGKGYICTLVPAVCSERSIGIAFQRAIVAADIIEISRYLINEE